jgi:hypothetical protein
MGSCRLSSAAALGALLLLAAPSQAQSGARTPDRRDVERGIRLAMTCTETPEVDMDCAGYMPTTVKLTRLRCRAEPTRSAREAARAVCEFSGTVKRPVFGWSNIPGNVADFRLPVRTREDQERPSWRLDGELRLTD